MHELKICGSKKNSEFKRTAITIKNICTMHLLKIFKSVDSSYNATQTKTAVTGLISWLIRATITNKLLAAEHGWRFFNCDKAVWVLENSWYGMVKLAIYSW